MASRIAHSLTRLERDAPESRACSPSAQKRVPIVGGDGLVGEFEAMTQEFVFRGVALGLRAVAEQQRFP